jgi:hypothetical protein
LDARNVQQLPILHPQVMKLALPLVDHGMYPSL